MRDALTSCRVGRVECLQIAPGWRAQRQGQARPNGGRSRPANGGTPAAPYADGAFQHVDSRIKSGAIATREPPIRSGNGSSLQRRARESNPQPLAGHLISNQTANHSLTLQTSKCVTTSSSLGKPPVKQNVQATNLIRLDSSGFPFFRAFSNPPERWVYQSRRDFKHRSLSSLLVHPQPVDRSARCIPPLHQAPYWRVSACRLRPCGSWQRDWP